MALVEERPSKVGIDAIMQYWEESAEGTPYWSIWWNSRQKAKQFNKNNFEESKAFLQRWLELNDDPSDTTRHYLVIQGNSEAAYNAKSDQVESFPFRFNPAPERYGEMAGIGGGGGAGGLLGMMQAIAAIQKPAEDKAKRFEDRIAELEKSQPAADGWGQIAGLLDNPHLGPVIAQVVAGIIGKLTNNPYMIQQRVAINGVPGQPAASQNTAIQPGNEETEEQFQQRVNQALIRLQDHCNLADDLTKLADVADNDPGQFAFLLKMLRNQ